MNWENPELKSLPDDSSKYCREFAIFSIPYIRDISGMDSKKTMSGRVILISSLAGSHA